MPSFWKDWLLFSIQDKSTAFVGTGVISEKLKQLDKDREYSFLSFFKTKGVEKQVKFYPVETAVPFNGFSFYKIDYNGELPESLKKAYDKMNELNLKKPRMPWFRLRKKENAPIYDVQRVNK